MITIKNIGYSRGYSHNDHLLDDRALRGMIGSTHRSVAAARKAAGRVERKHPQDRRCMFSPIWIECLLPDESTVEV